MTLTAYTTRHAEVAVGLTALRDFLLEHPDLPLSQGGNPCTVYICDGTDAENRAEVDRIAVILDVTPEDPYGSGRFYEAIRDFGGGVAYVAAAQSRKPAEARHARAEEGVATA